METNNLKLIETLNNRIIQSWLIENKSFVVIHLDDAKAILEKLKQLEQIYQQ